MKRDGSKSKELSLMQNLMLHLVEELGELSQQVFYKKAKPGRYKEENVKEKIFNVNYIMHSWQI